MWRLALKKFIADFFADEQGAAASEYAITLAFIASAIAAAVSQFDLMSVFPAIVAKIAALIN